MNSFVLISSQYNCLKSILRLSEIFLIIKPSEIFLDFLNPKFHSGIYGLLGAEISYYKTLDKYKIIIYVYKILIMRYLIKRLIIYSNQL